MRYAFFDKNGRVETACNDDTVSVLPEGALELSDEQWAIRFDLELIAGKLLVSHRRVDEPSAKQINLNSIAALESTVTERRIRESVLGIDGGWLKALNDQIADLRAQLA